MGPKMNVKYSGITEETELSAGINRDEPWKIWALKDE